MEPLVLDLAGVDASLSRLVGGKAAHLGELIRAGFPVPPGVCVTTEAYRQVAASAAIDFEAFDAAGPEDSKRLAGTARAALLAAPIPGAVARAVAEAYARLGHDVPVAVRSDGLTIEWSGGHYDFDAPVSRIVAVPGKRLFVAEVEKTGIPLDPAGANLWLFGVP